MENEIIILTDEGGNEYEMQLIQRFDHENQTYVVLTEAPHDCGCGCEDCRDECGGNVYVMKEDVVEGNHCYSQVDEEKIDELIVLIRRLLGVDDDCGCGCEECAGHCDCEECADHCEHE
ncbi:MAG: DUF1292 domain-containing protein [Eubacteriales bacterium]|nr:DUF1292 domain-containing protein [Eubacteriales bacterium]